MRRSWILGHVWLNFLPLKTFRTDSRFEIMALYEKPQWLYCVQNIQKNKLVTVETHMTGADDAREVLREDNFLIAGGPVIYKMKEFAIRVV